MPSSRSATRSSPGPELYTQVAVERFRDAKQRVDARRPSTGLEARDRRLGRAGQLGQLLLGETLRLPLRGDLLGDAREKPSLVGVDVRKALAKPFESIRTHISPLL